MIPDIFLALGAFIVAVIGIVLNTRRFYVKASLILIAAIILGAAIVKGMNDESDKKFIQTALISALKPSNSSYEKLCNEIDKVGKATVFDKDAECHHSDDGMIVLLSDTKGEHHATVVFNSQNVADMYADHIKKSSDQNVINEAMQKLYDPKNLNEEFLDKVGILGFNIYFNMFDEHPSSYNYDPKFGVKIAFDKGGQKQIVQVSPEELQALPQDKALNLFQRLGESFREKFKKASE